MPKRTVTESQPHDMIMKQSKQQIADQLQYFIMNISRKHEFYKKFISA